MNEEFLKAIRDVENFNNAIVKSVVLDTTTGLVEVNVITDKAFGEKDEQEVCRIIRQNVPQEFSCTTSVTKLSPDEEMVKQKIAEAIKNNFKALSATVVADDIQVKKCDKGFTFTLSVVEGLSGDEMCETIVKFLKRNFCGEFLGKCVDSKKKVNQIEISQEHESDELVLPVRYFKIDKFSSLETKQQQTAVYISDLNFEGDVVVCGVLQDIREKKYVNAKEQEKPFFSYAINDGTATLRVTHFPHAKVVDRVRELKIGDSVVFSGKAEVFNGSLRFTAKTIDLGQVPRNFVPEERPSKPVPKFYTTVTPQVFADIKQTDIFGEKVLPKCLIEQPFIVFDIETTGLLSTPTAGKIDDIIEIGAYKIENGVLSESFSTFINPQKKLSDEIIKLTGITDEMLAGAPTYEKVMPDFFKFCQGNILVGHNIANFDFKFVDFYCSRLGYVLERKIIDTYPLSQELLFLSNYKLNTIADHFKIEFNHHRALEDALVTAKIFIELIKIKKSLPKLQ